MNRWIAIGLRLAIAGLLLALLTGEVLIVPAVAGALVEAVPRIAEVEVPLVAVVELVLVCVQVALVCTWALLGLVERQRIFAEETAVRFVDMIVGASALATVFVGGLAWLSADLDPDLPALVATLAAAALFGVGFTLLVLVMRALLKQASQLRADMAEVI